MRHEPLADYLEPQFGNIYNYNLVEQDGFDVQPWTDELRQAVNNYLVNKVDLDDYMAFLDELSTDVPDVGREAQAEAIIAGNQPWEVANAFHLAAVKAVPTLDELIGRFDMWPDDDVKDDASEWLDAHASPEQLHELAEITNHPERDPRWRRYQPEPRGWHFTEKLAPPVLLRAWHDVAGLASSDLTDEEWELLVPVLPPLKIWIDGERLRSDAELQALRQALNGIRYKFARDIPWARIPKRYGASGNIYQRYRHYIARDDFASMVSALQGNPNARPLVIWLQQLLDLS